MVVVSMIEPDTVVWIALQKAFLDGFNNKTANVLVVVMPSAGRLNTFLGEELIKGYNVVWREVAEGGDASELIQYARNQVIPPLRNLPDAVFTNLCLLGVELHKRHCLTTLRSKFYRYGEYVNVAIVNHIVDDLSDVNH